MPKPRRLSGKEVVDILESFGFQIARQRGSHIQLTRAFDNRTQKLVVPNHKELDTGTVVGIFRQATQFIPPEELRKQFYSE